MFEKRLEKGEVRVDQGRDWLQLGIPHQPVLAQVEPFKSVRLTGLDFGLAPRFEAVRSVSMHTS